MIRSLPGFSVASPRRRDREGAGSRCPTILVSIAALAAALVAVACVPPPFDLQRPAVDEWSGVQVAEGTRVRVVTPFADERTRPPCRRDSGFSANMGSRALPPARIQVVCSRDIGRWLAEDVERALARAGFAVVGEEVSGDDVLVVHGNLLMTEIEPLWRIFSSRVESDYRVRVEVRSGAGLVAHRDFHLKSQDTRLFAIDYEGVFVETHRRTVSEITEAIADLANELRATGALRGGGEDRGAPHAFAGRSTEGAAR